MTINIENDHLVKKILLIGDGAVGKTTLTSWFITGGFSSEYRATIGVDVFSKIIPDKKIELRIWDLAGQPMFKKLRSNFFRNACGGFLVFDLTVPNTLSNLSSWIDEVNQVVKKKIPLILIGNKLDLVELHSISEEEINYFVRRHTTVVSLFFTSAIKGTNVSVISSTAGIYGQDTQKIL
ncbi:MAG: Rab family GTPase [Candidatus Kariarchaeaceae archaeon]|jgi:small GTP-binding protein